MMLPEDEMMGGMMPPEPMAYPGAMASMQAGMAEYIGMPQMQDLLGLGQYETDVAPIEAEFSPPPVPLYQLAGGMEMAPMGMSPPDASADPFESDTVRADMRDLLAERAKSRLSASESFQAKAQEMAKGL